MDFQAARRLKARIVGEILVPAFGQDETDPKRTASGPIETKIFSAVNGAAIVPAGKNEWRVRVYTERPLSHAVIVDFLKVDPKELLTEYIGEIEIAAHPPIGTYLSYPNGAIGTLGCYVKEAKDGFCLLSNNHVLANYGKGKMGDPIVYPGIIGTGVNIIGHVNKIIPIDFSGGLNEVDCATAKLLQQEPAPVNVSPWLGKLGGVTDAVQDGFVQKVGHGTGWTTGKVTSLHTDVVVNYKSTFFRRRKAIFSEQLEIRGDISAKAFSDIGDSGSLVVENQPGKKGVGLVFATTYTGITFANPINKVLTALLVDIL